MMTLSDDARRDLTKLAADRVNEAIHTVMQLVDDPKDRVRIGFGVAASVFGMLGALTAAAYEEDHPGETMPQNHAMTKALEHVINTVVLPTIREMGGGEVIVTPPPKPGG